MLLSKQITNSIHRLHQQAQQAFHRRMLVLSGSEAWCMELVEALLASEYAKQALFVTDKPALLNCHSLHAGKLTQQLGSEYQTLIWDGFSGLHPDGLGIASGLLKGGGLFILLLPPLEILITQPDNDYLRMFSPLDSNVQCHTYFLQRLVNQIRNDDDLLLIEQGKTPASATNISRGDNALNNIVTLPTNDQLTAISAIKKVSFGHRHRPLVIKANRGRGKSSALGLAAAEIYIETQQKLLITAPSKQTCTAAFRHYKTAVEDYYASPEHRSTALSAFEFIALDSIAEALPECHLLFIDEAAAIPVSILNSLLRHYPRIVFSTTIHGYEGNGQGFAIRFQKSLATLRPQWKLLTLTHPIRWADNDPLEAWFFKFLLLDARLTDVQDTNLAPSYTTWLDQTTLTQNEAVLEQVFSLLVSAHYQTRPSDLRLILDHPKAKLVITHTLNPSVRSLKSANTDFGDVLGVCLIIEEGGFESPQLAEDIISGKRRPRGQLFPQALCASTANPKFLEQRCYRIMRIAVHPALQNKGLGSNLLARVLELAKAKQIDSLTSSYGLTPELLSFWHKSKFSMVKLGLKIDGASGLQSIMMMQAISVRASELLNEASKQFSASFIFKLSRQHQYLATDLVTAIFQTLPSSKLIQEDLNSPKIEAFAQGQRSYEESDLDIFNNVLSTITTSAWKKLTVEQHVILIIKVLQNRDQTFCLKHLNLNGKKQLDLALRKAVSALLDTKY